jgi:hypothetical protein
MSNNDIPPGWSMIGYMVTSVSESVNKKPKSPENVLQTELEEMARYIALIEPDPQDWGEWVTYLQGQDLILPKTVS